MHFDLWTKERAEAVNEGGLLVLRKMLGAKLVVMIWRPKATKPYAYYSFKDEAGREAFILKQVEAFKAHQAGVSERKVSRKASPEKMDAIKINQVFYASWGYDQTNIDFYQVVGKTASCVLIRPISSQASLSEAGDRTSDRVMPALHMFKGEPELKRVSFSGSEPRIAWKSYANLYPFDGKPKYETALGFGH